MWCAQLTSSSRGADEMHANTFSFLFLMASNGKLTKAPRNFLLQGHFFGRFNFHYHHIGLLLLSFKISALQAANGSIWNDLDSPTVFHADLNFVPLLRCDFLTFCHCCLVNWASDFASYFVPKPWALNYKASLYPLIISAEIWSKSKNIRHAAFKIET